MEVRVIRYSMTHHWIFTAQTDSPAAQHGTPDGDNELYNATDEHDAVHSVVRLYLLQGASNNKVREQTTSIRYWNNQNSEIGSACFKFIERWTQHPTRF